MVPIAQAAPVVESEERVKTRTCPRYKVLCHDDPITTMDFVVGLLRGVFKKTPSDAQRLMMEVHRGGVALIEVVPFELAELHVDQAHSKARGQGFPLTLSIEPAD